MQLRPIIAATGILMLSAAVTDADIGDQLFELRATDGAPDDFFGWSVAIDGPFCVVGALRERDGIGAAYIFSTASGQQLAKLTGDDEGFDKFGVSVAISGSTIVVGASEDANGFVGAAYVFDAASGSRVAKLVPSDGQVIDSFGYAVDVDGGRVVVGAPNHDAGGTNRGGAYLFDAATGSQIAKLQPGGLPDAANFGGSVAIGGGRVVVGAAGQGVEPGSAFLFDAATGQLLSRLIPSDVQSNDFYGWGVAISDSVVLVASPFHENGSGTIGAVYAFDASTGQEVAKIAAPRGNPFDDFGQEQALAISGNTAIIGAKGDDLNGADAGTSFLFNGSALVEEIQPDDGAALDRFGQSVDTDGALAIVGARGHSHSGPTGAAYLFVVENDTDGDGLLDSWEMLGVPYLDENGAAQRFVLDADGDGLTDADPERKDIFVEVDQLAGITMDPAAAVNIRNAFAAAPVDNPDGSTGISLHIVVDELFDDLPDVWPTTNHWPTDFDDRRIDWFGTEAERFAELAGSQVLIARARAFRYCVLADRLEGNLLGVAEDIPSDDFVVAMGAAIHTDGNHDTDDIAGTWMHELGHCLGLGHGGGDDHLGKPNYPSIMNYMFVDRLPFNETFWTLDFSRAALPAIDENNLDENVGIASGGPYDHWIAPFGVTKGGAREVRYAQLDGRPTDFGTLGSPDGEQDNVFDTGVEQDLNYIGPDLPVSGANRPTPTPSRLISHDDWANLEYPIVDGSSNSSPRRGGELTDDAVAWMEANFPPPPGVCLADWNDDDLVDTRDVLAFLNSWNAREAEADVNGDGYIDTRDVLAFLNAWTAGCRTPGMKERHR